MNALLSNYPIRPDKHRDESLMGYAYRFFGENGMDVPFAVSNPIRSMYVSQIPTKINECINKLGCWLPEESKPVSKVWISDRRGCSTGHLFGSVIYLKLREDPKYCPICLAQLGYWLQVWDLPLFDACPLHHVKLIAHCHFCWRPLEWKNIACWRCICGASLVKVKACAASKESVARAAFICQTTSFPCPSRYRATTRRSAFVRMDMSTSYVILYFLSELHKACAYGRYVKIEPEWHAVFRLRSIDRIGSVSIGKELEAWPNGIHLLLRRLLERRVEDKKIKAIPVKEAQPLHTILLDVCNEFIRGFGASVPGLTELQTILRDYDRVEDAVVSKEEASFA